MEILKDPHTGAFAVIGLVTYLLLYMALISELVFDSATLWLFGIGLVMTRILSGIAVASFACAKGSGLMRTFSDASNKRQVAVFLSAMGVLLSGVLLVFWPLKGAVLLIGLGLVLLYYRLMSYHRFGGITGDLQGYFLQISELTLLLLLLVGQKCL